MIAKPFIIQDDHYQANQSWCLDRIYSLGQHRIRVKIRRNAYDEQSYAVVESWHMSGWQQIAHRHISFLACKTVSYQGKDGQRALFDKDATVLYHMALAVLGVS